MRKFSAVFLAVILLFCTVSSAAAETLSEDTNETAQKYDKDLMAKIASMEDDEKADFIVQTEFDNMPTKADIDQAVAEKTDIDPRRFNSADEVREYYEIRRGVRDDLRRQAVLENMAKMGVTFDDVKTVDELYTPNNVGRKGMPYAYILTKAQVEHLIEMVEVTFIGVLYPTGELFMSPDEKISERLHEKLAKMSAEDHVAVWAWQYDISSDKVNELIREAYGDEVFKDEALFRQARLSILADYYSDINTEIADILGVAKEDRMFISSLTPSFILYLTPDQVNELAYMNKVYDIGLYDTGFFVPDGISINTEDPLFEKFMAWGNSNFGRQEKPVCGFKVLYTKDGEWSVIDAPVGYPPPWEVMCGGIVGNRFVYGVGGYDAGVSYSGYMLYDEKKDEFYSLTKVNTEEYDGLLEALEKMNIGLRMGDADTDGEITIVDATRIQRIIADLDETESVNLEDVGFNDQLIGDYDCDGTMTVLDATAIQRFLAGL